MALKTATNDQTGESVVLVGGEWKPVARIATNDKGGKAYLVGNEWMVDDAAPAAPTAEGAPAPARAQVQNTPAIDFSGGMDTGASEIMGVSVPNKKNRSVLEGQQMPVPEPSPISRGVDPKFVAGTNAYLNSLPRAERGLAIGQMQAKGGIYAQVAEAYMQQHGELDKTAESPVTKRLDPRLEARVERKIAQGRGAEGAEPEAAKEARMGYEEKLPQMTETPEDVIRVQEEYGLNKNMSNLDETGRVIKRMGAKGVAAGQRGYYGVKRAVAEFAEVEDTDTKTKLDNLDFLLKNMGESKSKPVQVIEGAAASIIQQAPAIIAGLFTGSEPLVLASMFTQAFGQTYDESRRLGLSPQESAARSAADAAFEIAGERLGLGASMKAIKASGRGLPLSELSAYYAKALAREIPGEEITYAGQFAVDKAHGLNKEAGVKQFIDGAVDTALATVAQAGMMYGGGAAANKLVKTAQNRGLGEESEVQRPSYERDQSYEGTAEAMMRQRGFLQPEAKTAPAGNQQVPPAGTRVEPTLDEEKLVAATPPGAPANKEQKIEALAERIASRGVDPQDALAIAKLQVESDEQKKLAADEAAAEELPTYYPKDKDRLSEIFRELVDEGVPPNKAQLMAGQQLAAEKEDRKIAAAQARNIKKAKTNAATQTATTGATNVGQPITEASGVSPELAGQPDQIEPTAGAGEPTTDGMVLAGEDVAPTDAGEAGQPSALTPKVELEPESREAYAERTKDEPDAPRWEDTDARVNRVADRYEQAGMPEKAAEARESLQQQRPTYAGTAEREVQQEQELATQEGAQVGTETTEAVQAEAQGQEPAPAAEVTEEAPKGKRGRKPLAPEQKSVSEQKRKQQRIEFNALNRKIDKIEADLNDAATPINEEEMDTDEQIKTLSEEKRRSKNAAIRALYEISKTNKGAPGKRASELLKNPAITKREMNDAVAAYDLQKKLDRPLSNTASMGTPDPAFAKVKNAAQALTHIIKTSKNPFQKFLAERLRSFVNGVEFVVLEKGDALPDLLQKPANAEAWERSRGMFLSSNGKKYVFLRGESFGDGNGVNNITVLHELLHAATNKKIELGLLANNRGFDGDAKITKFVAELRDMMVKSAYFYDYLLARGEISKDLQRLVRSTESVDEATGERSADIFDIPQEFLAYGMSDPVFQEFLNRLPGTQKDSSMFSRFVTSVLDLFGLGKDRFSALSDLINVTDQILSAKKTSTMRLVEYGMPDEGEPYSSALPPEEEEVKPGTLSKTANPDIRTAKEVIRDVDIAINQVAESETAEQWAESASALQLATDPKELAGAARRLYDKSTDATKRALLHGATTDFVVEMAQLEIPELKNTYRFIQQMNGMTARLMEGAADPSTVLFNAANKNRTMIRPLYRLMLESTLAEIDPSTDRRSAKLNARYDALPPAMKNAYNTIRDYFKDMMSLYRNYLDDQVKELGVSSEDKANLMTKLKALYEVGQDINPYFALVRRGEYWLRVAGKGKQRQFYLFRTMQERDKVATRLAAQRKLTVGELKDNNEFELGNSLRSLRLDSYDTSAPQLTALMDAIDNMKFVETDTRGTAEERQNRIEEEKNKLKDAVYQMYLMTLPDQSFRKSFISRKGITGFTTDMLQNFSDTASTMSVQLSRIKYGRRIRNSLLAARKSIANRPELEPYTDEMEERVRMELPSSRDETWYGELAENVANFANRASYLYYLSGVSSALLQPVTIIQLGYPVLGARYGYGAAALEFSKGLKVWNSYGMSRKNSDGSTTWTMPTMRNAKGLDALEKRAMDHMVGRNVGQVTLAGELMAQRNKTTVQALSLKRRVAGNTWYAATSALMQTAERLAQEGIFLSSFRLQRKRAKQKFRATAAYKNAPSKGQAMADFENQKFDSWIDQAVIDTHESLGNMTPENRPPIMRAPGGKISMQFNMFPLHNYIMLGKNATKMVGLLPAKDRVEASKIFWGHMAATVLLAGASGAPLLYTMIGFLSGMWRDWWRDKDLVPADLREMDFKTWLREKWLPEQLGDNWARLVDRGVLNYVTGADFSSRLGLNNAFLREGKEVRTDREWISQVFLDYFAGPSVNMALTFADGMSALRQGDYQKAREKFSPAFIRNWLFWYKQGIEGAKDSKGAQILSKDAITNGELIWRAVGFNSDALSTLQTNNFSAIGNEQAINNDRAKILNNLDKFKREGNFKAYTSEWAKKDKFNVKYPWIEITEKNIDDAFNKREEQRGTSWNGFNVTDKNAPYAVDALSASRRLAQEKEKEGKKRIELKGMANKE